MLLLYTIFPFSISHEWWFSSTISYYLFFHQLCHFFPDRNRHLYLKHPSLQHIISCAFHCALCVFKDFLPMKGLLQLPSWRKGRICRLHVNSAIITISLRRTDSPQKPAQSKTTHTVNERTAEMAPCWSGAYMTAV